jgi:acyl-CoA reductase-like NAD-dependent aldehyde dehydrogenase
MSGAHPQLVQSRNPATLEVLGSVQSTAPEDVAAIVNEVASVRPLWAQLRVADRVGYLERAAQAVVDEFDELCGLIASESGRPGVEVAAFELLGAIDALRWLVDNAGTLLHAKTLTFPRAVYPLKRANAGYSPRGVVAVIGAGSGPFAALVGRVAAALLGGNGVVVKPAPRACLTGERVAGVLARAGFPEGLVRVVHGGAELGSELVAARGVAHVFFAGSPAVAGDVAAACGRRGASVTLDAGPGEAMIVLEDAHLPGAVAGALWSACTGAGQLHGALGRVYVEAAVHEPFIEELSAAAAMLRVGDPRARGTQVGPLANETRRAAVWVAVERAVAAGATRYCGEPLSPDNLPGAFQSPTILGGSHAMLAGLGDVLRGPVLGVSAVADSVEAVALANGMARGQGASIWTSDRRRAARIARDLHAPIVWCNDHIPSPGLPQSGGEALAACVEPKLIAWDPPTTRTPWRYPYDATGEQALRALVGLHSTRHGDRERALRAGGSSLARVAGRAVRGARR